MRDFEREIELYDYIEVLLNYKWVIFFFTLLCGLLGWYITPDPLPPFYEADAVLMIKGIAPPQAGTPISIPAQSSGFYQALALADDLKQDLLDALELDISLVGLDGMLEVQVLDPGVRLTARAQDPSLPIPMVNKWAELFVERNRGLNIEEGDTYYEYVVDQYRTARDTLEAVEDSLYRFETINRIGFLNVQQATFDTIFTRMSYEVVNLELELEKKMLDLNNTEELIRSMELDGNPVSFMDIATLKKNVHRLPDTESRRLIDNMLSLEKVRQTILQLDEELRIVLFEFDKEHNFAQLEEKAAGKDLQSAELENMRLKINNLEKELAAHVPLLEGSKGGMEINPVYFSLAQQLADLRVEYEVFRVQGIKTRITSANADDNLSDLQRQYHTLLQQRQRIVGQFNDRKMDLVTQERTLQKLHNLSKESYIANIVKRDTLLSEVQILKKREEDRRAQLSSLQKQIKSIKDELSEKLKEQRRLLRDQQIFSATVSRFSTLVEEARIAREKAAGDIRVLTRALEVRQLPRELGKQKAAIAAGVGFLISAILSLLVEYVRKARKLRAQGESP